VGSLDNDNSITLLTGMFGTIFQLNTGSAGSTGAGTPA
jgi:hypothetical protein